MWPFRGKKTRQAAERSSQPCNHCQSAHTKLLSSPDNSLAGCVRVWRGQRFLSYRCLDCGRNFYVPEPAAGPAEDILLNDHTVDEEELLAAEEDLKRQLAEERRRRIW